MCCIHWLGCKSPALRNPKLCGQHMLVQWNKIGRSFNRNETHYIVYNTTSGLELAARILKTTLLHMADSPLLLHHPKIYTVCVLLPMSSSSSMCHEMPKCRLRKSNVVKLMLMPTGPLTQFILSPLNNPPIPCSVNTACMHGCETREERQTRVGYERLRACVVAVSIGNLSRGKRIQVLFRYTPLS